MNRVIFLAVTLFFTGAFASLHAENNPYLSRLRGTWEVIKVTEGNRIIDPSKRGQKVFFHIKKNGEISLSLTKKSGKVTKKTAFWKFLKKNRIQIQEKNRKRPPEILYFYFIGKQLLLAKKPDDNIIFKRVKN